MEDRRGFWRRQFSIPPSVPSKIFDAVAGVIAPILCLTLDPGIFVDGDAHALIPDLPPLRGFAYIFIGLEVSCLAVWLSLRRPPPIVASLAGSAFLAGGVLSLALGLKMLPLTFIGMLFLIGVLGFTPFFTAFACFRNAWIAFQIARSGLRAPVLAVLLLVGAALPLAPAVTVHVHSKQALARLIANPDSEVSPVLHRFGSWRADDLVWEYDRERDPGRKARIAKAYQRLTGGDVEARLASFQD